MGAGGGAMAEGKGRVREVVVVVEELGECGWGRGSVV